MTAGAVHCDLNINFGREVKSSRETVLCKKLHLHKNRFKMRTLFSTEMNEICNDIACQLLRVQFLSLHAVFTTHNAIYF